MKPMGTALHSTDYAAMARGMGIHAQRVERVADLPTVVRSWLSAQGPALLDVAVDTHALALPPDTGFLQALGYAQNLSHRDLHHELDTIKRLLFGNRRFFG